MKGVIWHYRTRDFKTIINLVDAITKKCLNLVVVFTIIENSDFNNLIDNG
jgi:hypothetical protein